MLRLMDNLKIFGFKIESTPYTAETLAATDYNQRVYDIAGPPEIESYGRKLMRGDFSRDVSISGKRKGTITCSVDLYPGDTVDTAPQYFAMFRACGWSQHTWGATGISLVPNASYNRVPATIEYSIPEEGLTPRQIVFKYKGCMGKVTLESAQVGQPIKATFEFQGALVSVSTRSNANYVTPTAFDSAVPPAVLAATFSLFGTWQYPSKFTVDGGEDVQLFSDISQSSGYHGARIVDRNATGTCDPDMVVTDDLDLYTNHINNTTGQLSVTIGGGVPLILSAPAAQLVQSYQPEAREGHIANALNIEFKRSTTGNDELELLQGSKT